MWPSPWELLIHIENSLVEDGFMRALSIYNLDWGVSRIIWATSALSLPLSQAPLEPTKSSALLHPQRTQLPNVVLSLKHAWFPLPSHYFSSSSPLPLLLFIFVFFHSWRNILCDINISPKGPLIYYCVMGSWQLCFHSKKLFLMATVN